MRKILVSGFVASVAIALCLMLPVSGHAQSNKATGYFIDGPVQGLTYRTPTQSGSTDSTGRFNYLTGETVTFSIGDFVLGSSAGAQRMTPSNLVPLQVPGQRVQPFDNPDRVKNRAVANMARFVQSLDRDGNVENGIVIDASATGIVGRYAGKINFDQDEAAFTSDPNVTALFRELNLTLRTPAQAKNMLRRTLYGIHKTTDVKVPVRDGSYMLADVFKPIYLGKYEKYPVVMSSGSYGKMFGGRGCICNQEDAVKAEEAELKYFDDLNPHGQEHFETLNTIDFVPNGYVLIRTDQRGTCNTPGRFEQFSLQEAKDYYDTIEWAGKQPWSNGKVGIHGSSYYGMNSFYVSQFQPPSLKAMLPIDGDPDSYRDYIYTGGGLYNTFNSNTCIKCIDGKQYSARQDGPDEGERGRLDHDRKGTPFMTLPSMVRRELII